MFLLCFSLSAKVTIGRLFGIKDNTVRLSGREYVFWHKIPFSFSFLFGLEAYLSSLPQSQLHGSDLAHPSPELSPAHPQMDK